MAGHKKDYSTIVEAANEADNQISKIRFLCEVLACGENPVMNTAAAEGAYFILNDIANTLESATQTLFEAARDAQREQQEREHGTEAEGDTEERSE